MVFRIGESDSFPFSTIERGVWYAIITSEPPMNTDSFTSSKSGKQDFVNKIKQLTNENKTYIILGIWQGKWKTDIFILDKKICIREITKLGEL